MLYVYVKNSQNKSVHSSYLDTFIQENNLFFNEIYPLKDNGIEYERRETPTSTTLTVLPVDLILNLAIIGLTSNSPDLVIGVLPNGTLTYEYNQKQGTRGLALSPILGLRINSILVENVSIENEVHNTPIYYVAHESGHTYGLCDEESNEWPKQDGIAGFPLNLCPNGDDDPVDGKLDDACKEADGGYNNYSNKGCRALTFRELHSYNNQNNNFTIVDNQEVFRNFMGYNMPSDRRWISKESYEFLLDELTEEPPERGEGILISAFVYKNGSYKVKDAYMMNSLPLENNNSNKTYNYSIKLYDANNSLLFEKKFHPSFMYITAEGETVTSNVSVVVFAAPFNSSLDNIQFLTNGSVMEQVNRSPNTPSITLVEPVGGEVYLNSFNVTWNASDADNDSLTYFVQISNDNGSNWTTIAVDLNVTYLELDNADFSYGTNYKAKVYVSDGINTNSSESASNFTIVPPPSVSVNGIDEVYSLWSLKLHEVEIENDGGQDLDYLQWSFNTGLETVNSTINASLESNDVMNLLFEYNYSSGGWMNVSLYAYDNNKSVNDTYSELFFVGDLLVGGFKQLYGNATLRAFEFLISNQGSTSLTNVGWTVNTSDNLVFSSGYLINLSAYETAFVLFEHNFSDSGSYNLTVNVSDDFNPYNRTLDLFIPDIVINDFRIVNQSDNIVTFGFGLENALSNVMNASYTLYTGLENLTNSSISIGSGQNINFSVEANYSTYGDYTAILNTSDDQGHSIEDSLSVSVNELAVSGLQKLYSSSTLAVFEFIVENLFSINKTFSWSFDTNDTAGTIWSDDTITLTSDENITVFFEHNFSSTGTYEVSARANTSSATYSESLNTTIG
ncbi:hypothetical protein KY348_01795 [Candidatus Woesearchaeota archaeon]|nr:hypothetical protein [Candidatus Woesearchaeota archaeon]